MLDSKQFYFRWPRIRRARDCERYSPNSKAMGIKKSVQIFSVFLFYAISIPVGNSNDLAKELTKEKIKLDKLQIANTDTHPEVQRQLQFVEYLEKELEAATEPTALQKAKIKLNKLRISYTDEHPKVKSQILEVKRLENEPVADIKLTPLENDKAELKQLRMSYTDDHPIVQRQLRIIKRSEKRQEAQE